MYTCSNVTLKYIKWEYILYTLYSLFVVSNETTGGQDALSANMFFYGKINEIINVLTNNGHHQLCSGYRRGLQFFRLAALLIQVVFASPADHFVQSTIAVVYIWPVLFVDDRVSSAIIWHVLFWTWAVLKWNIKHRINPKYNLTLGVDYMYSNSQQYQIGQVLFSNIWLVTCNNMIRTMLICLQTLHYSPRVFCLDTYRIWFLF